jgi:hypothetical protein
MRLDLYNIYHQWSTSAEADVDNFWALLDALDMAIVFDVMDTVLESTRRTD